MHSAVRQIVAARMSVRFPRRLQPSARSSHCHKNSACTKLGICPALCTLKNLAGYLSPWYLLWKVGVPKNAIIGFRRGLKRIHYPWLSYCLPSALALGVGDYVAQNWYSTNSCRQYDYNRTMKYALIGFGLLGPILYKWNYYLNRMLRCKSRASFVAWKITLNQVLLAPVLLGLVISIWDMVNIRDKWPDVQPLWEGRYKKPFWEIIMLNVQTRPLVALFLCYICPGFLLWYLRALYEVAFATYVSNAIERANLGGRMPPPERPKCKFHKTCTR